MGILTNLANTLIGEVVGLGFDQLDAYVTREINEGREANAFKALDQYEEWLGSQVTQGNQRAGILPINNDPGVQMQVPQSMGLSQAPAGPMDLTAPPDLMKNINKSTLASQMAYQKYNQALQNDPYYVQKSIQQEAQKNRQSLVRDLTQQGYNQNQMGFQEALGAFDNPAGYNLTREERNRRSQERQLGQTSAQYQAAEPFKEKAMQRSMQLKQTPTYAQTRGGGGGAGEPGAGMPTAALNQVDKILAQAGEKYGQASYDSLMGNLRFQPNEGGMWIKQRANDIYAAQGKKKNFLKAVNQAMSEWDAQAKQQEQQEEERIKSLGRLGVNAPVTQQPTVLQNLPTGQPANAPKQTPLPTALPNLPRPQPTQAPTQTMASPTALSTIQKIAAARSNGYSDAEIREALKGEGLSDEQINGLLKSN